MGNWKLRVLLWALLAPVQLLLHAQTSQDSFHFDAPWRQFRLDNGMEIAVLQDKSLPLCLTQVTIRAGSHWEPRRMSGWSCLLSSLLTASNRNWPGPDSFRKSLYREGILYDHFVSPEMLSFRLQGMQDKQEWMLTALQSALQYPAYTGEMIANARARLLQQAEEDMSDPLYFLRTELQTRIWGKEMHRQIASGTSNGIVRADSTGLYFFRKHFFVPYRTLLVVISPEDPEMVFARVQRLWGRWSDAATDPEVAFPLPAMVRVDTAELVTVVQEYATLPVFMAGWQVPPGREKDAQLLAEVLNAPDGNFRRNLRDTTKVRELQFQVSGNGMYLTLLPDPRNYLLHGPDSLMVQIRKLCDPGFFTSEEVSRAIRQMNLRERALQEKLSDRATAAGNNWASGQSGSSFSADPAQLQQLAQEILVRQGIRAGFLTSTALSAATGLSDYFYPPLPPDSFAYSLEGDSLMADSALEKSLQGLAWWLTWHPGGRVRLKMYVPALRVPDALWDVRRVVLESFIRNRIAAVSAIPPSRRGDFSFEFIKDAEAILPGLSAPPKEEPDPAKDAYQFYLVPEAIRYDTR